MIPGWLAATAGEFWAAAGPPPPFPRDLDHLLPVALPVYQVVMPRVRWADVEQWLLCRGRAHRFDEDDRFLRGAES